MEEKIPERPITRRAALLAGAGLGIWGLVGSGTQSGVGGGGNNGNGGGNSDDIDRSSLTIALERELDKARPKDTLRLQIHTEPDRLDDAIDVITDADGDVRSSFDTLVIADIETNKVRGVANSNPVRLSTLPIRPETHSTIEPGGRIDRLNEAVQTSGRAESFSTVENNDDQLPTTEGVEISGADVLHKDGITGDGATVAILDRGFDIHNEQYADQVVAILGELEGEAFEIAYENPGGHGDNVADIVAAMAPEADLVLADMFFGPPFLEILEEIETEFPETDVTTMSVGFFPGFRLDGLDPVSLRIADFTEAIDGLFVTSAGNAAAVENAWSYVPGVGPVPLPQNNGQTYDSRGAGEFEERNRPLLNFDANFEEALEESTRLPIHTVPETDVVAVAGETVGWLAVHWDADWDVDDQIYQVRLYKGAETNEPVVVSRTRSPWEEITVLGEDFVGEVEFNVQVDDGEWIVKDVEGEHDVAPIDQPNPTLVLPAGQRYRIWNEDWREHPLEFRMVEEAQEDDEEDDVTPLLSQDRDGVFEDEEFVDWVDRGRRVEFTLTQDLAAALDTYVSAADDATGGDVVTTGTPPVYLEVQRLKADEDHHFDIWTWGDLEFRLPWVTDARSIGLPATSQDEDLLSIAAVQAVDLGLEEDETALAFERNAEDLKGYSSQGPTQDGRRGIDIAGPSHVSTNARGPVEEVFGFNGTSAAAPHVAGGIALLSGIGAEPGVIREALFDTGNDIADEEVDPSGEDNTQIGFGYLDVPEAYGELGQTEGEVETEAITEVLPSTD